MATAIGLVGTAISVKGQLDEAKALENAAIAAEEQAKHNAQVAVNNMVGNQNDLAFRESAAALDKKIGMEQSQVERKALRQKLTGELGTVRARPTFGGSYTDIFKSAQAQADTQLAEFDFEASQKTYEGFKQYQDFGRQMGLAYSLGMADRDMTLSEGANKAYQFRVQANQSKLGAFATGLGGLGDAAGATDNFKKSIFTN